MAWQTPKTDWAAADGVRDTDFNRIEGNILELYRSAVRSATTVYVNAGTGNDTSGDGSQSKPYATINKALSTIPKNLNGQSCVVNVAAGTYNETVNVRNFAAGNIVINGSAGATVTVTGLDVQSTTLLIDTINLSVGTAGIFVGSNAMLLCANGTIIVNGANQGLIVRYGAVVEITTTLQINNAADRALYIQYGSTVSIGTLIGTGNNIGIYLYQSILYIFANTLQANVLAVNENGVFNQKGVVG